MFTRNKQGIAANKVIIQQNLDLKLFKNGWIYFYDISWYFLLHLLYVHSILRNVD
jgi:putative heme degradation protein